MKKHSIKVVANQNALLSRVFLDGEQLDCVVAVRVEIDASKFKNATRVVLTLAPHEVIVDGDDLEIEATQPL